MTSLDQQAAAEAIDNVVAGLERATSGLQVLASLLRSETSAATEAVDPADPRNKQEVGGLLKLTPRGVEVCYRLFDAGKSRYAVAQAMGISFGAATHRLDAWRKAGGTGRRPQPLA